jgi:hypothetical protein
VGYSLMREWTGLAPAPVAKVDETA